MINFFLLFIYFQNTFYPRFLNFRPHIININWLEESIKLNQPAAEECFFVETEETLRKVEQPPSPLCKKVKICQFPRKKISLDFLFDLNYQFLF